MYAVSGLVEILQKNQAGESLRTYCVCVYVRIRTYAVCGLVELQEPHVKTYLQRTLCMTRHLVSLVATRSMYVRRLSLVGTNSLYVRTPLCVLGQYIYWDLL